jgi:hypothetical protein
MFRDSTKNDFTFCKLSNSPSHSLRSCPGSGSSFGDNFDDVIFLDSIAGLGGDNFLEGLEELEVVQPFGLDSIFLLLNSSALKETK